VTCRPLSTKRRLLEKDKNYESGWDLKLLAQFMNEGGSALSPVNSRRQPNVRRVTATVAVMRLYMPSRGA
jgi:hypothetical protein